MEAADWVSAQGAGFISPADPPQRRAAAGTLRPGILERRGLEFPPRFLQEGPEEGRKTRKRGNGEKEGTSLTPLSFL